jgi:hypothetical protein
MGAKTITKFYTSTTAAESLDEEFDAADLALQLLPPDCYHEWHDFLRRIDGHPEWLMNTPADHERFSRAGSGPGSWHAGSARASPRGSGKGSASCSSPNAARWG